MLFDPREVGEAVEFEGSNGQPSVHQPTRRRPADDFLTIPSADTCPQTVDLKWRANVPTIDLIAMHFNHGELKASDVASYEGATNAMHDALMAWINRESASWTRLNFGCVLMDVAAVQDDLTYTESLEDFEPTSAIYLGFQTLDDDCYFLTPEVKAQFDLHPLLLRTALRLIDLAGTKTISMRTPDHILDMFASWLWDGDSSSSDKDALDWLEERYDGDQEMIDRYLPSVVRRALCPEEIAFHRYESKAGRYRTLPTLSLNALKAKTSSLPGPMKQAVEAMVQLAEALRKAGKRRCFDYAKVCPSTFFAASNVALANNDYLSEGLDDHYNYLAQSGEGSYFHGYVPLATTPKEIRRQYADLSLGFSILKCADRLLALICKP